jgi:hypothetical protein
MARWTFTLDLCGALKDDSKVDDRHKCPTNTRGRSSARVEMGG